MLAYNGYQIATRINPDYSDPVATVFDVGGDEGPVAVYRTTSIDLAVKWIDAYRKGEQWAVEARQYRKTTV